MTVLEIMLPTNTSVQLTTQLEKRLRALMMANNRIIKKHGKTSDTEKICKVVKFIQEDVRKLGSMVAGKEKVENENKLLKSQLECVNVEAEKAQRELMAIGKMREYVEGLSRALDGVEMV